MGGSQRYAILVLMSVVLFAAFIVLGVGTWLPRRPWRQRRGRVSCFIIFFVAVSLAVGLLGREKWPFTTWRLVSGRSPTAMTNYDFELVSAAGRRLRLDPRVWQPASDNEILDGWVAWHIDKASAGERDELARFVLDRAERARQSLRAGGNVGVNGWLLGPLAAPYAFQRRPLWHSASDVPDSPFVEVRLVREQWDVRARFNDESLVAREVVHDLHAR
jgi:hypothetical protein